VGGLIHKGLVDARSTAESAPRLPGEVRLQRRLNVGDLADHGESGDQHNEDPVWRSEKRTTRMKMGEEWMRSLQNNQETTVQLVESALEPTETQWRGWAGWRWCTFEPALLQDIPASGQL